MFSLKKYMLLLRHHLLPVSGFESRWLVVFACVQALWKLLWSVPVPLRMAETRMAQSSYRSCWSVEPWMRSRRQTTLPCSDFSRRERRLINSVVYLFIYFYLSCPGFVLMTLMLRELKVLLSCVWTDSAHVPLCSGPRAGHQWRAAAVWQRAFLRDWRLHHDRHQRDQRHRDTSCKVRSKSFGCRDVLCIFMEDVFWKKLDKDPVRIAYVHIAYLDAAFFFGNVQAEGFLHL